MSKRGLALSSLVMAVPAGYLAYLCVRSVFGMNESMPAFMTAIIWTLIVISGLLALSPFIFLVAGPSGAGAMPMQATATPAPAQSAKQPSAKKKASDDEDEFSESGEVQVDDDDQLFDASDEEAGAEEFEDQFNFDDDDIDNAFDDEDEEPAPRKKKR